MTATANRLTEVTILENVSYADNVTAAVVGGVGYWVTDLMTQHRVDREDGTASYTVYSRGGKAKSCSCPAFRCRGGKPCKHLDVVNATLARW